MTREDAYYERIMLLCGYWDSYEQWLNSYLETEDPLSDIVLELLDCHNDMKEVEYRLNLYCLEKPFDEETVYVRLRLYAREKYRDGIFTIDEVMSTLFRFSQKIPFCDFQNQCSVLSDYYVLVDEGVVDMALFQPILKNWLDNGGAIDTSKMWC